MNTYKLSKNWFDWCADNPEKIVPKHTALYFYIIDKCNRLGWRKKFGLPTSDTMLSIGIKNKKTYYLAFNDLIKWGFIILVEKRVNQNTANIISISAVVKNGSADGLASNQHCTYNKTDKTNKQKDKDFKKNPQGEVFDPYKNLRIDG
jgi:hypothetical protein